MSDKSDGTNGGELARLQAELTRVSRENQRLQATTQHLNFLDEALDGYYFTTPHDEILFANQTLLRILGYRSSEADTLIGSPLPARHWADERTATTISSELERRGFIRDYRVTLRTLDNEPQLVSLSAAVNHDKQGRPTGIQYTVRPVPHPSRRGTAELRAENRELAALTVIGRSVLSTMNMEEVARHLMQTALNLFDLEGAAVLIRQKDGSLEPCCREGLETEALTPLTMLLNEEERLQIRGEGEHSLLFQRRSTLPGALRKLETLDAQTLVLTTLLSHEKQVGMLVMASPAPNRMTEEELQLLERIAQYAGLALSNASLYHDLQQAYDELKQAQVQLVEAERQKVVVEMAGAAAHELNQPLTVLLGYSTLLARTGKVEGAQQAILTKIESNTRKISEIVARLGQITRYRTREYIDGLPIVDIDASSRATDEEPTRGRDAGAASQEAPPVAPSSESAIPAPAPADDATETTHADSDSVPPA